MSNAAQIILKRFEVIAKMQIIFFCTGCNTQKNKKDEHIALHDLMRHSKRINNCKNRSLFALERSYPMKNYHYYQFIILYTSQCYVKHNIAVAQGDDRDDHTVFQVYRHLQLFNFKP